MGIYVDILQGGTNSHGVTVEDFNGIATDLLADGVVGSITNTSGVAPMTGAFAVNAQATPDMTVAVTQGVAYITGTPTSGTSMRVRVKMDAAQNVSIASNSTGGTRYDWLYIKLDPDKMKDPDASASDVATLVTSRSTSSTTDNGTPPTYGYCIAVITVANGASSITNGSIADKRAECLANIVTTPRINNSSVTIPKLSNPYKARAVRTSAQTINDNTHTQVQLNVKSYDPNNNFSTSTYNYTVPVTGYYQVNAKATIYDPEMKIYAGRLLLKVNSDYYAQVFSFANTTYPVAAFGLTISDVIYLTADDTVGLYVYTDTIDGGTAQLTTSTEAPYMSIHLLSV